MDLDYVLVMEDGSIVEEGAPEELLMRNGRFASLAREEKYQLRECVEY